MGKAIIIAIASCSADIHLMYYCTCSTCVRVHFILCLIFTAPCAYFMYYHSAIPIMCGSHLEQKYTERAWESIDETGTDNDPDLRVIPTTHYLYLLALDTSTHFKNNNQEMATEKYNKYE